MVVTHLKHTHTHTHTHIYSHNYVNTHTRWHTNQTLLQSWAHLWYIRYSNHPLKSTTTTSKRNNHDFISSEVLCICCMYRHNLITHGNTCTSLSVSKYIANKEHELSGILWQIFFLKKSFIENLNWHRKYLLWSNICFALQVVTGGVHPAILN